MNPVPMTARTIFQGDDGRPAQLVKNRGRDGNGHDAGQQKDGSDLLPRDHIPRPLEYYRSAPVDPRFNRPES